MRNPREERTGDPHLAHKLFRRLPHQIVDKL